MSEGETKKLSIDFDMRGVGGDAMVDEARDSRGDARVFDRAGTAQSGRGAAVLTAGEAGLGVEGGGAVVVLSVRVVDPEGVGGESVADIAE